MEKQRRNQKENVLRVIEGIIVDFGKYDRFNVGILNKGKKP